MTEENKDSNPLKLRLSRKPIEPEVEPSAEPSAESSAESSAEPSAEPKAEERSAPEGTSPPAEASGPEKTSTPSKTSAPNPNLRLKQQDKESKDEEDESAVAEAKQTPAPEGFSAEIPAKDKPEAKPVEPPDDRAYDPENPFQGIAKEPEPEKEDPLPAELPGKPEPEQNDGAAQKVEKAIGQAYKEKRNRGLLVSIIVIIGLLALLGGSGYGLYYVLQSPSETSEAFSPPEQTAETGEVKDESGSLLSKPIAKAKAVVSELPDSGSAWTDEEASTTDENAAQEVKESKPVEAEQAAASPPSLDSAQTSSVSEFLKTAHIGGVRMGNRPKLILNGQSYDKGDLIDPNKGLRFIGIRDKKLAFQDAQGIVYIKSF